MVSHSKNGPDAFRGRGELHSIVYGMRNWQVTQSGRLTGVIYSNAIWDSGENVAKCLASMYLMRFGIPAAGARIPLSPAQIDAMPEPDHDMSKCAHGLYAYYDGSRDYHDNGPVTGVIKGWGEGVLGNRGFRVTRARIVAIKFDRGVPKDLRALVRENYPDAVEFKSIMRMLKKFPLSADDLEYVPDPDDPFWMMRGTNHG